jgi:radical SAM protein with 4Fe4S-binding SPASM domain
MNGNHFSLILLSTNRCNADCDYCFEDKTRDRLTHEKLALIMHMVDELGVTDFQINTPFPGGAGNAVKSALPLAVDDMARFHCELADVWLERGYYDGVRVGPFDELLNVFTHRDACLPCIWGQNCADEIVSIDARGFVAQCDCWVTSYPEYFFGNIFDCDSFSGLLANSKPRRDFYERPVRLMEKECISCDFLSLCHGGCPVRTYTVEKTMFEKDPYCGLYKALFAHMRDAATRLLQPLPAVTAKQPVLSA